MPMTKCRECGKDISSTADNCPHCGAQMPAVSSVGYNVYLILCLAGFIAAGYGVYAFVFK